MSKKNESKKKSGFERMIPILRLVKGYGDGINVDSVIKNIESTGASVVRDDGEQILTLLVREEGV